MKRYLGKEEFEGFEVADSDFEELTLLREDENYEITLAIEECERDIADLLDAFSDGIADLAYWRDSELDACQAQYNYEVREIFKGYEFPWPRELFDLADERYFNHYLPCCDDTIEWYDDEYDWLISQSYAERGSLIKYRDSEIEYIRDETTSQIEEILNARYYLPVYMINNKPGACEFCVKLNKVVGTLSVLIKKRYIPPFHYHCRCFLTQAGYVVMSGITTEFVISELLSEAASEAGVGPSSLVPTLPPIIGPSKEADDKKYLKWLAEIAAWWEFWTTYYPIPTKEMYVLHG